MEKIKYKLKGHETFCIREGWLAKGIHAVNQDPSVFKKNYGADALGVGSNMAKAIRYWLKAFGLTEEKTKTGVTLSEFGMLILQRDPYFEQLLTLWLLHINLCFHQELCTSWYLFFKKFHLDEFVREDVENQLEKELSEYINQQEFSKRSLHDDITVLLQMYAKEGITVTDPEEKKICPFTRLGMIRKQQESYKRTEADLGEFGKYIVWYVLCHHLKEGDGINIEDFYTGELGVKSILGIGRGAYQESLDGLERLGIIDINRTAGLDMIYLKRGQEKAEVLKEIYKNV